MASKFILKWAANEQFMFNLLAENGEIILTSELYHSKEGARNGITSVKIYSRYDCYFEKRNSYNQPYFILKAANNEIIGTSELYSSNQARDNGIASVKSNAPTAGILDIAY